LADSLTLRAEGRWHFVQLLAMALVSLLFAVLLFAMAMMDQQRMEGALYDMLKKRAFYVVEGLERAAQDGYRRLTRSSEEHPNRYTGVARLDEAFAIQEGLGGKLISLARYIDYQERTQRISHLQLEDLAASEQLSAIALLDEKGQVVFQTGSVPPQVLFQVKGLAEGRQEVAMRLVCREEEASERCGAGFVGIRREDGMGGVLLLLEPGDLRSRELGVSIQEAVEAAQGDTGLIYLAVEDTEGQPIAQAGRVPEGKVEECLLVAGSARHPDSPMSDCVKVGDIKFLEVLLPFKMNGQVVGKARVGLETQETDELLIEKRRHIFVWTGLMVAVGFLAMGFLYRTQNRHLAKLQAVREQLYQGEKLSSLAKLGAEVAHEVRNPLNGISMAVQRLQRDFTPAENEQKHEEFEYITHKVRDEIRRINAIIEDFLSLSRSDRLEFRRHSLKDVLAKIVFLVMEEVRAKGIRIEKQWEQGSFSMLVDANKMEQALLNLLRNAADSVAARGTVKISLEHSGKNLVSIKIRDTGPGISPGEAQRVFEPYYSTKEKGTGLGLSIAREIILAHGGEIRVASEPGKGTTFEVRLPLPGQRG